MRVKHFAIGISFLLAACLALCFLATVQREIRERRYVQIASQWADRFDIPHAMALAVIRTESDFHPNALSAAGASGLMQLMPETFRYLRDEHLKESLADSAIWDPDTNIRYGCYYLSYLFKRFGDWKTALAAYNAGESRVAEWLEDPRITQNNNLQEIPFEETEQYIKKVFEAFDDYTKKYKE